MKLDKVILATVLLAGFSTANATQCVHDGTVTKVLVGYKEGVVGCPDVGACIYFEYKTATDPTIRGLAINAGYNLNDANIGLGHLTLLKTALLTGAKIDAYDHWGTRCDDIDEIALKAG
ncbi:hypothetical protein ACEUAY_21545 [Aeromonas veronii]